MRSGFWRGVTLAIVLACASALTGPGARADLFHLLPREVPARNLNTGGPYYAPPIPYGEYAKDYAGTVHGAFGALHGYCSLCLNKLCGNRHCGRGLFHRNRGGCCGQHGSGPVIMDGMPAGGFEGMPIEGMPIQGAPIFAPGQMVPTPPGQMVPPGALLPTRPDAGRAIVSTPIRRASLEAEGRRDAGIVLAGHYGAAATPQAQAPLCGPGQSCAAPQSAAGAGICGACGGRGCGLCGHRDPACGSCGGRGCGLCGGTGLLGHGGSGLFGHGGRGRCGDPGCGLCNGGGHGLFGHGRGQVCGNCGGRGCALCSHLKGLINKALHRGDIRYFVGPGGPVPLTPGYVPYVVPTRSPRDFFAFPPFFDQNLY